MDNFNLSHVPITKSGVYAYWHYECDAVYIKPLEAKLESIDDIKKCFEIAEYLKEQLIEAGECFYSDLFDSDISEDLAYELDNKYNFALMTDLLDVKFKHLEIIYYDNLGIEYLIKENR
jgi:hypothetical protein